MNKIICEICGTVYPESSPVCPICGYHRVEGEHVERVVEEPGAEPVRKTQSVKGGRFSAKNVKKRHKEQAKLQKQGARKPAAAKPAPVRQPDYDEDFDEPKKNSNKGLIITIVVLIIAIMLVSAYIAIRFFSGGTFGMPTESASTTEPSAQMTEPEPSEVLCSDLVISDIDLDKGLEFTGEGRAMELVITAVPVSTTEEVLVTSSDENVIAVSEEGGIVQIVSVGEGEATITVTCGSVSRSFPVKCNFTPMTEPTEEPTEESTEPTEETTQATTEPADENLTLKLNRTDITFYSKGETFTFSAGSGIRNSQVLWTSADESVAKIENGTVTAVGKGTTTITAEYNGKKESCIIRCSISDSDTGSAGAWKISHSDVSISVGETFTLKLRSSSGETADVTWSISGSAASVSGSTVKGEAAGTVTVSCTYEGETYECIVRVTG